MGQSGAANSQHQRCKDKWHQRSDGSPYGRGPRCRVLLLLTPSSSPLLSSSCPRDSALSHPFLLFPVLFPHFLIQIPPLTPPAYYSFPLQSQEPSMAGPVLCSLIFVKQAGWLPLSDLQPFQEEPPGHHSSPGSGLGSSCPAPVPRLCLQAPGKGIVSILQWHKHLH